MLLSFTLLILNRSPPYTTATPYKTTQIERALLEEALRTGVDSSEGMDILAVAYDKLHSLLPFLPQRKQQGQGDAGSPEKDEEAP